MPCAPRCKSTLHLFARDRRATPNLIATNASLWGTIGRTSASPSARPRKLPQPGTGQSAQIQKGSAWRPGCAVHHCQLPRCGTLDCHALGPINPVAHNHYQRRGVPCPHYRPIAPSCPHAQKRQCAAALCLSYDPPYFTNPKLQMR